MEVFLSGEEGEGKADGSEDGAAEEEKNYFYGPSGALLCF